MDMTVEQLVLYSMYDIGAIERDNMGIFKTRDISIKLERKSAQLWYTDTSYKYLCILTFIDNINGREILKLSLKETDIFVITDAYEQFMSLETDYMYSPIIHSGDNIDYCFCVTKQTGTLYDDMYFIVYQNAPNGKSIIRVKILLSASEFIDFFDLMYFVFIIDIVSNEYENYIENNNL